jgi:hypothetical protein
MHIYLDSIGFGGTLILWHVEVRWGSHSATLIKHGCILAISIV